MFVCIYFIIFIKKNICSQCLKKFYIRNYIMRNYGKHFNNNHIMNGAPLNYRF